MSAAVAIALLLCIPLGFGQAVAADEAEAIAPPSLEAVFARYVDTTAVQGTLRDTVLSLDPEVEDSPSTVLHIQFWLQRPNHYHFIVNEADDDDRQHYLSNGVKRWQVEVVLDNPIVDLQPVDEEDLFTRVQRLLHLERGELEQDFELSELLSLTDELPATFGQATALPAAWHYGIHLIPHTPDMRSELEQVLLVFDEALSLVGLIIDDRHQNRRRIEIDTLTFPESLDPAIFVWQSP